MDSKTITMVQVAATIRKAVNFPAYARGFEAHTDGMAELITHLTGGDYREIRDAIVTTEKDDPRTTAQASQDLADADASLIAWAAFDRWLDSDEPLPGKETP